MDYEELSEVVGEVEYRAEIISARCTGVLTVLLGIPMDCPNDVIFVKDQLAAMRIWLAEITATANTLRGSVKFGTDDGRSVPVRSDAEFFLSQGLSRGMSVIDEWDEDWRKVDNHRQVPSIAKNVVKKP